MKAKQRAHDGHEHRDERAEQERGGEERRVIDGELDLERKVHRPDLRDGREPEQDRDDQDVLRRRRMGPERREREQTRARDDHTDDVRP